MRCQQGKPSKSGIERRPPTFLGSFAKSIYASKPGGHDKLKVGHTSKCGGHAKIREHKTCHNSGSRPSPEELRVRIGRKFHVDSHKKPQKAPGSQEVGVFEEKLNTGTTKSQKPSQLGLQTIPRGATGPDRMEIMPAFILNGSRGSRTKIKKSKIFKILTGPAPVCMRITDDNKALAFYT